MTALRDVMTPKQVAEYLQLHPITIYRYINDGRLIAAKIGGRYRIKREAVDNFLTRQELEIAPTEITAIAAEEQA